VCVWLYVCGCVCVCVYVCVTLALQHAMGMRRIVICGPPRCTIFFHIISQTARFSEKKTLLNAKCVFWFPLQLLSETLLILRRSERDMIKNT